MSRLHVSYVGRPELQSAWLYVAEVAEVVPLGQPVDLIVSAAGSHIFRQHEIDLARCGVVNLHLAPLPEFRGRYSAAHAILTGARWYGATLHYVPDEGIDTGPIIAQERFIIGPHDTAGFLRRRALEVGARIFRDWWPMLVVMAAQGRRLPAVEQDESKARYFDRHSLPPLDPDDPVSVRAHTL